jgi:hypothetical protein
MKKIFLSAVLAGAFVLQANAQLQNNQSKFEPVFDFRATPTRSASGMPGEAYWQNRADYVLNVELDPEKHSLKGTFKITYTNNSPDNLPFVWLQLDQNKFKEDSRGTYVQAVEGSRNRANPTSGYTLENVKVGGKPAQFIITDTRMQVRLDVPVKAKGGKVEIEGSYSFEIPEYGSDRMGRIKMEKGWIYNIAQWYPRMCVYDDIKGWNVEPYLGSGEFYLEYGNIDFKVTTPSNMVVLGSGALQNPAECYTAEQLKRWEQARNSDKTVDIISESEVGTPASRPTAKSKITWHFKIENTRDAAFGASSAFIVDAARINLPSGKKILAISGYSKESIDRNATGGGWERSTEYSKASIEHYSKMWFEFPYATANNIAGNIGGMEYPGVNFCSYRSKGDDLWGVTDHEFGHNWFPMIVGNNERLYPWMDEGFNTFINHYSTMAFNNGEYFDPKGFAISNMRNPQLQAFVVKGANREAIATYPDVVQDRNLGVTAYYKPGAGMWLLREYILGPERFDFAFRSYIKAWAFKHPQPADFFNFMNNAAGDELAWFWKAWFYGTGTIDQSVANVSYVKDDPKNGSLILVKNNGDVMPVVLEVTEENGKKTRLNLPVEIWQKTNNKVIRVNTTSKVLKAEIDPDKVLPDVDGSNDVWSAEAEAKKKAIEEENKRKEEEAKKKAEEEAKKKAEEEEGKGKKKKKKKGE